MSYCKDFNDGKDKVMFMTQEDLAKPSTIELAPTEPSPGLILPNGDINWNCPCLGGMATGPCGVEFREAFSCFHYSEAEPKGSDCYEVFSTMQSCFSQYPSVYKNSDNGDENDMDDIEKDALERIDKLEISSKNVEDKETRSSSTTHSKDSKEKVGDEKSEVKQK